MIKPFKLDHIKKVSRHEVLLVQALYNFFPLSAGKDKLPLAIRKTVMKHLGQDIRYYVSSVDPKGFGEFVSLLPAAPVVAVLGLSSVDKKIIVHIDSAIASLVIGKLLGGAGSSMEGQRPLTETEQGVLQYLIMQILSQVYSMTGNEVHLRFERFIFDPKEILRCAPPREGALVMTIDVTLSDQAGFVRLVFPYSLLDHAFTQGAKPLAPREKGVLRRELEKWGFVRTSVWAEAGCASVSPHEMSDLAAGDVVLFDESGLTLAGGETQGNVRVHFGSGEASVEASVVTKGATALRCRLDRLV